MDDCEAAFSNHAETNMKTEPRITYSPAILKKSKTIAGIVCPNRTATKFENEMTANAVKMYVFQSKILNISSGNLSSACFSFNYFL